MYNTLYIYTYIIKYKITIDRLLRKVYMLNICRKNFDSNHV